MLYALLFLPALLGAAYVLLRPRPARVLEEAAVAAPPTVSGDVDPLDALEALLGELERATLDERDVAQLETLADELEAAAARLELERVG